MSFAAYLLSFALRGSVLPFCGLRVFTVELGTSYGSTRRKSDKKPPNSSETLNSLIPPSQHIFGEGTAGARADEGTPLLNPTRQATAAQLHKRDALPESTLTFAPSARCPFRAPPAQGADVGRRCVPVGLGLESVAAHWG